MQVALASSIMAWVRSGELVDDGQEELQNGGTLLAAQVPSPKNMYNVYVEMGSKMGEKIFNFLWETFLYLLGSEHVCSIVEEQVETLQEPE